MAMIHDLASLDDDFFYPSGELDFNNNSNRVINYNLNGANGNKCFTTKSEEGFLVTLAVDHVRKMLVKNSTFKVN